MEPEQPEALIRQYAAGDIAWRDLRADPRSLAHKAVTHPFSLIVTDTSPLLTLVLADALDVLLRPGIAVSVPDAAKSKRRGSEAHREPNGSSSGSTRT